MPPVVQVPAPLFRKVYIDPMHMPPSYGTGTSCRLGICSHGWVEWRAALTRETERTLGQFIFKEILCRWGGLEEIVTDSGTAFVAALD
ncbi:hypothetical protein AN958_06168 [Leucoagaricus sp. SymC.cos]|nr:hypothetical protein AN958_06168 [Leucoagaricus sp. SymC.cos]